MDVMTDAAGREFDRLGLDGLGLGDVLDGQAGGSAAPEPEHEPPAGDPDRPLDQRGRDRVPSRGGRPSLYTPRRVLTILAALFNGATRADAARRAGVGVSTFYVWL